ncbi:putative lipoprotein [Helicobacter cinaedi PAGU611]|uniref:LPP20 family lipoprotein n=1 Tax=Helicobacter cinaedi TaxID=213 RepID=UPI00025D332B|nr:LPP20 family lipoprotein [Helicobacter cinaedi]QOQ95885.1 LPP20 family lipoprotein [Helicobacter cinaedi]BAM12205.1 putative lipoprotein [Helicobacter cinaedi PAGU611]
MNTKAKLLAGSVVAALLLIGCGGDDSLGVGGKSIDKKALKALNLKGAPNWVLNAGQGDMSAIGDAEIVGGDLGFARNEALALARDEIARQVSVSVKGSLLNAKSKTKSDMGDASMQSITEEITKQSTDTILSGTKQTDTWITGDGSRIFVLAKLDEGNKAKLEANVKKQIAQNRLIPNDMKREMLENLDLSSSAE